MLRVTGWRMCSKRILATALPDNSTRGGFRHSHTSISFNYIWYGQTKNFTEQFKRLKPSGAMRSTKWGLFTVAGQACCPAAWVFLFFIKVLPSWGHGMMGGWQLGPLECTDSPCVVCCRAYFLPSNVSRLCYATLIHTWMLSCLPKLNCFLCGDLQSQPLSISFCQWGM